MKNILNFFELKELTDSIIKFNEEYRNGKPSISDEEYDKLLDRLKEIDPSNDLISRSIIESSPKNREEKLPYEMMSLDKYKTPESLHKWANRFKYDEFIITPKFDGISIELNESKQAWTRGDGTTGQRCDKQIGSVPNVKKSLFSGYVRGEMIILNDTWNHEKAFRDYKHPRNTVNGWVSGDYSSKTPYHLMTFMAYDYLSHSDEDKDKQLDYLNDTINSIYVPYYKICKDRLFDEFLEEVFNEFKEMFPIDGLVIEANKAYDRNGKEANGNPSYSISYKSPLFSSSKTAIVEQVKFNINRYGMLTPTVHFPPMMLSGAEVKKANGINARYIQDWGIREDEVIEIVRSGEVIPKITKIGNISIPFVEYYKSRKEYNNAYKLELDKRKKEIENPINLNNMKCPFCGSDTKWDESNLNLYCCNERCDERLLQQLVEFFNILEAEDLAESTIRTLYNAGFNTLEKILNMSINDAIQLKNFASRSATLLMGEINRLTTIPIPEARLMHASGIFPNMAEKTLQLILDSIVNNIPLNEVKGIGDITYEKYNNGLKEWNNFSDQYSKYFNISKTNKKELKEGPLSGRKICFTGCRPDSNTFNTITNLGGDIVDGMSKLVTDLVAKDINSSSSKFTKAREYKINILSYNDLLKELKKYDIN